MKSRMLVIGSTALCVALMVAASGGLARAEYIGQTFDTDSANMAVDYPQYSYALGTGSATVSGNVLYIQDRTDGADGIAKYTMTTTNTAYAADTTSGKLTVDVDLGCEPLSGGVGRIAHGVMLGDPNGNWLAFAYHPGYGPDGFFVEDNTFTKTWSDPGFTPSTGLLQQHMKVEYNGVDTFDVTLAQGTDSHTVQYVDARLGGSAKVSLFTRNGQGWGTSNFDNLTIVGHPIPEPASFLMLATGMLGLLAYAWRKRK